MISGKIIRQDCWVSEPIYEKEYALSIGLAMETLQENLQGGRFRTPDVYVGRVGIPSGIATRDTRRRSSSSYMAHAGYHDEVLVHVIFILVVRGELEKSFWRGSVYRRE